MQSDINGQVLGVSGRTTSNGKTIYEIQFSDGQKYTTFVQQLAGKAQQLQGQPVTARVEVKQNGQYTNFYLIDIAQQGMLPAAAIPAGTPVPVTGAIPVTPAIPMQQGRGGMDPERERKIVKQSVMATSFAFVGQLLQGGGPEAFEQGKELALGLAKDLFGQVFAVSPNEVAQEVNAQVGVGAVQVGAPVVEQPPAGDAASPTPEW